MQDIKKIKKNPELFKEIVRKKNLKIDIDALLALSDERNQFIDRVEDLRQKRNQNVEEIKKIGGKPPQNLIQKGKEIKEQIAILDLQLNEIEIKYKDQMLRTPQIFSSDTPEGKDESGNIEIKKWSFPEGDGGKPKDFDFKFKDHIELGKSLDILDIERGTKTGGFRAYYLKNEGALMHMALMMYAMKKMKDFGFTNIVPPTLVNADALFGSGHFPFDEESVYTVDTIGHDDQVDKTSSKKYLVGTSEPSLLNYYRGETLKAKDLPIKLAGFSQCYRGEIGSYGRDTKGIYRVHEFMKIEQVVICDGNYAVSEEWHKKMLEYSETILQELKLPYRVIQLCTGDMGAGKYKMFDIETWMPSRNSYGETHSASNLGDWQTRRLDLKVEDENGDKHYPHALNNTVIASPRILIAIWENFQNENGEIEIPEVLQEYLGGIKVITSKNSVSN